MAGHEGDFLDRIADVDWMTFALWIAAFAWTVAGVRSVFSPTKAKWISGIAMRSSAFENALPYIALAAGTVTLALLARPYAFDLARQLLELE
jgi:hypothetical protein